MHSVIRLPPRDESLADCIAILIELLVHNQRRLAPSHSTKAIITVVSRLYWQRNHVPATLDLWAGLGMFPERGHLLKSRIATHATYKMAISLLPYWIYSPEFILSRRITLAVHGRQ